MAVPAVIYTRRWIHQTSITAEMWNKPPECKPPKWKADPGSSINTGQISSISSLITKHPYLKEHHNIKYI
jgi:hypothetical protein